MKLLVTGSDGMLGCALMKALAGRDARAATIHDFDITSPQQTSAFLHDLRPQAVINCAAYTNVDGCETNEAEAFAVNAEGVRNLALGCKGVGAKLVHISTDYVFDGAGSRPYTEDDPTHPVSAYGRSKLQGETLLRGILQDHVIIRTQWLYGPGGVHFVGRMLELARSRDRLEVVNDQVGSPTCTTDLAGAIVALLDAASRGTYHFSNAGSCSWYEFARRILAIAGMSTPVLPITSDRLARPARRPAYSVFDCSRYVRETGREPRRWERALEEFLADVSGRA